MEQVAPLALAALLVGLVAIAMRIWPESDEPKSDPESVPASPSPWVTSLISMFALGYSANYISVLTALSLRFDYVEELGVPARRTIGPVLVPQRPENYFAKPTY